MRTALVTTGALLAGLAASTAGAQDDSRAQLAFDDGEPKATVSLLADVTAAAPSDTVRVGVLFELAPRWHVYWKNPGESGTSTEVVFGGEVTAPAPVFPIPERFVSPGPVTTYGYSDRVLFSSSAVVSVNPGERIDLTADVDFLVCRVDCIPARATLRRSIEVGARAPSSHVATFERSEARLPRRAEELGLQIRFARDRTRADRGDRLRLGAEIVACEGRGPDCDGPLGALEVFPERTPTLRVEDIAASPHPDAYSGARVFLTVAAGRDRPPSLEQSFRALLRFEQGGQLRAIELAWPIPRGRGGEAVDDPMFAAVDGGDPGSGVEPSSPSVDWLWAVAFGLFGGLLLNLMPCVLPVLAIKALSFVELSGATRSARLAHAGAYLGGVVASMLLLAAFVLTFRASGVALGWGFQFQQPLFLAAVGVVLTVFAMNLFGVFEVQAVGSGALARHLGDRDGWLRSVGEGVLTVALATPCSAPLLGTAVGFALAEDASVVLSVFSAIGVGLATPFCLLVLLPPAARWLPKPGPWMMRVRELFGLVLVGTTVWLSWLAGQLLGPTAMALLLGSFVAVAAAVWAASRLGAPVLRVAGLLLFAGAAALALASLPEPAGTTPSAVSPWSASARSWSPDAVRASVAADRVAFVVFTADWCITCKANERLVLEQSAVRAALAQEHVDTFVADWTAPDDAIRAALAEHGKAGVPLYLVFRPGSPDSPEVLPELLTPSIVLNALDNNDAS